MDTRPPHQNRVDPWGRLHAVRAQGTIMGNRGILHNEHQEVVRPYANKSWVTCLLSFGDVPQKVFAPGHYSQLFFLDEATAFAAGHRPCAYCQRARYNEFKNAWTRTFPQSSSQVLPIGEVDAQLHRDRIGPDRLKRSFPALGRGLPAGSMFSHDGSEFLVCDGGHTRRWSFHSYGPLQAMPAVEVQVLTPASIVELYRSGFVPRVHPTAMA